MVNSYKRLCIDKIKKIETCFSVEVTVIRKFPKNLSALKSKLLLDLVSGQPNVIDQWSEAFIVVKLNRVLLRKIGSLKIKKES